MVELSKDGIYSSEPHINHTLGIGPNNLTDVTLCHRFRVSYLKPVVSYMVSYASSSADNTLTTNFEFDRASRGSAKKEVKIRVRFAILFSFFSCNSFQSFICRFVNMDFWTLNMLTVLLMF